MKNLLTITTFLLFSSFYILSQTPDLFNENTTITWLGMDFSHLKITGDFSQFTGNGTVDEKEIKDKYFPGWNDLFVNEPNKYDIKGMLDKNNISYDINMINEINLMTDISQMRSYNIPGYTSEDIQSFVKQYDLSKVEKKDGIGIVFIAETFNKVNKIAYFHFVALDLKTGNIILQDRLSGSPQGFGIRNYWAGAFYKVIKNIDKKKYKSWEESNL
ncbi:hypothetical protein [Marinigracilibium pacificum]|uniref:Peptidase C39-like domain-containing protein n=1 Tax=Marinigracilibium pacificum TaxID=2729599 RepID=A0A848J070_9BACT|nr:hypothetical protein [Marinigracilibium pacificum]NMM47874.1 hypothetical protein [Marinigracilibium pacificum]